MGERRGRVLKGTCIKDTWTKPKWGRIEGEEHGGGKMQATVLEQQ